MQIEASLYYPVEAMRAIGERGPGAAVDPRELVAELSLPAASIGILLRRLARAGLLGREAHGWGESFRLARPAETIRLDEIAALGDTPPTAGDGWQADPAQQAAAALELEVKRHTLAMLRAMTLADLLPSVGPHAAGSTGGPGRPDQVQPYTTNTPAQPQRGIERLSLIRLWQWADAGYKHSLIDLREMPEQDPPAPPWARWIPVDRLPQWLHHIPRDRPVVLLCSTGTRSLMAAYYLTNLGFARVYTIATTGPA